MKINIPDKFGASLLVSLCLLFAHAAVSQSCIGEQGKIQWLLFEDLYGGNILPMYHHPNFPQSPDYVEDLVNLSTPYNYNNHYGSMIRGYLQAPETGPYVFNLTGDDLSLFFLSTDTLKENGILRAQVPGWSEPDEHDKYPEQTSDTVQLTAGEFYYFETHHKEGWGGDFIWVYWKTPSNINSADWEIIPGPQVYACACDTICPQAGTPCDDGDPATLNDVEDGHCHCSGTPATLPFGCIGERGSLKALYYDTISGSYVSSMYAAPKYPLAPDRAEILTTFQGPLTDTFDLFGTRIRGYLRPPVTGKYIFNVTGDNEVRLMLSSNETTTIADEIAWNDGYTDDYDHYDKPHNTSDSIDLVAGQFYAIEMVHKENSGGDDFYVFWKTPFAQDTFWHVIDGTFLYQYECEMACIPEGTPCNDGNPDTFDDVYDNDCNCAGTPCADPQCSNALGYTPYEMCNTTENHSTNPNSSWLSCQPSPSPNPEHGVSHWIQYDFGGIYALSDAEIWNYNAAGASAQGFKDVIIDYSLNGTDWSNLGTFSWDQATGTSAYGGFDMSEFEGISARYVLFTALSNFDSSGCVGLSEVSFNATTCPNAGTPCDDGNPETINDTYNQFCYCIGEFSGDNTCDSVTMIRNEVPVPTGQYHAELTITSSGLVKVGSNVHYVAGESITLEAGFEVEFGSEFLAEIGPCTPAPQPVIQQLKNRKEKWRQKKAEKLKNKQSRTEPEPAPTYPVEKPWLRISPNPASDWASVEYNLPLSGKVRIGVFDASGQLVGWLLSGQFQEEGVYQKTLPAQQLPAGAYTVTMFTGTGAVSERLVVVDSF